MIYSDLQQFPGVRPDPLTGRPIWSRCWNGHHERPGDLIKLLDCAKADCRCLCHPDDEGEGPEPETVRP